MAIKIAGTTVIDDNKRIVNTSDLPTIRPSLLLDFANSKTLDPRITFSRSSTATYWDGKTTTKAEENLTTYSQDYTKTVTAGTGRWTIMDSSITTGITAPDGTSTATQFTEGSLLNEYHGLKYTHNTSWATNTSHTLSVYLKNGDRDYVTVVLHGNSGSYASVEANLSNGTISRTSNSGFTLDTYTITAVGNSWYRVTLTATTNTSVSQSWAYVTGSDGTTAIGARGMAQYNGDGASTYSVWGVQIEQRSSATAYTPTTSSPITKYQPVLKTASAGQARFDHDPVTGESKGLLIEEARTNSHLSNTFEFDYNGGHAYRLLNQAIAPDGTPTAAQIVEETTTNAHVYDAYTTFPATGTGTASMFVKGVGHVKGVYLNYYDAFGGQTIQGTTFKLIGEGTASDANGTIQYVGNGWYRISRTWTSIANNGSVLRIGLMSGTTESTYGTSNYTGDGWSGILIWGTQQEAGAFPTSYIPNVVGGSQVTRAVDHTAMTGDNFTSWFSQEEGTFYSEHQSVASVNQRAYSASNSGSGDNAIQLVVSTSGGGSLVGEIRANATGQVFQPASSGITAGQYYRFAFGYKTDDVAVSRDTTFGTDSTSLIPTVNQFGIGQLNSSFSSLNGTIKKIAYYPKRLPNATLQAMTEA